MKNGRNYREDYEYKLMSGIFCSGGSNE